MNSIFIKPKHLAELRTIFSQYVPNATVWAYGSRVQGDAHSGSDLDLAISPLKNENIDIATLKAALIESNIPFLLDIFEFHRLPKSFQDEIASYRVEIFPDCNFL